MYEQEKYSRLLLRKETHARLREYAFSNRVKVWEAADELINTGLDKKQQ